MVASWGRDDTTDTTDTRGERGGTRVSVPHAKGQTEWPPLASRLRGKGLCRRPEWRLRPVFAVVAQVEIAVLCSTLSTPSSISSYRCMVSVAMCAVLWTAVAHLALPPRHGSRGARPWNMEPGGVDCGGRVGFFFFSPSLSPGVVQQQYDTRIPACVHEDLAPGTWHTCQPRSF